MSDNQQVVTKFKQMKKLSWILVIIISIACFSFVVFKPEAIKEEKRGISIEKAVEKGIVSAQLKGIGGHSGECIELEVQNLLNNDTIVYIEPGRRLVSEDSTLQDILIVKEIQLILAGKQKINVNLFGFCCQASNGGPGKDDIFDVGYMADSTWILLAEYLGKSGLPIDVMQSAVWVLSNNHSLSSIHNDNEKDHDKMKDLYGLLAGIKGLEYTYPWYTLKFERDTSRVFTGRPSVFYATIHYTVGNNANVDLVIRDQYNRHVMNLFDNKPHNPDNYTYNINLKVKTWPKGKYFLLLYVDNQMKMKKEFEL